jgi:type I site-specific restriction-modification system R (restriction) subunit
MDPLNLPTYFFRIKQENDKKYIFDEIRRRFVLLTPEEWVRQHVVKYLIAVKNFPKILIAVEKGFSHQRRKRRYDLLIYDRHGEPLMIVECKAPNVEISQNAFDQVSRYNLMHRAPYMLISNGHKHYCCLLNMDYKQYRFLQEIPDFGEMTTVSSQEPNV